jgi:hypothetical protein
MRGNGTIMIGAITPLTTNIIVGMLEDTIIRYQSTILIEGTGMTGIKA